MHNDIADILHRLSSQSVLKRKKAVKELADYLHHKDGHLARLSLHYVSEHDPSYTVRNIARQAFYRICSPPTGSGIWERAYSF